MSKTYLSICGLVIVAAVLLCLQAPQASVGPTSGSGIFWGDPDAPGETVNIYITSNYVTYVTINTNVYEVEPSIPLGFYMVPTRADLTLVATNNMLNRAITAGWLVPGDGGGRFYRFDAASTDSELDADSNLKLDTVTPYDISSGALVNPATAGRWLESTY